MSIEKLSSTQAFEFARTNEFAKYPRPDSGAERLFPLPSPHSSPSFSIDHDAKIFTMGSCFAREVDRALAGLGFQVVSRNTEELVRLKHDSNDESLYNKYTIHSILNEIRWALDPASPYPGEQALLEISPGHWSDPQLGGNSVDASLDDMLAFRESYCKSMKRIGEADVVVITLGLVEAWFDTVSGLFLNGAPPLRLAKKSPDRFEMHVLEYEEIISALEEIHGLVSKFGKPGTKFLVTVSPVPLLSTFRSQDVLVANTYSKAVQRAAVEKFVLGHDDVDYFPSYEFVALGNPNSNWSHDYRHVHPAVVRRIMASVIQRYAPGDALRVMALEVEINARYKEKDFASIVAMAEPVDASLLQPLPLYRVGLSYKKMGDLEGAFRMFALGVEKDRSDRPVLENVIDTAAKLNLQEAVEKYIAVHAQVFPESTDFRSKYARKDAS